MAENEVRKLKLKGEEIEIVARNSGDTDDKGQFLVKYIVYPKIEFVDPKRIISSALKLQGYDDREINEFIEGAEDFDEYREIIKESKRKFLEKYEKVEFVYPEKDIENISFPVKEGYVKKEIVEKYENKEVD